jgi:hypothetical protein
VFRRAFESREPSRYLAAAVPSCEKERFPRDLERPSVARLFARDAVCFVERRESLGRLLENLRARFEDTNDPGVILLAAIDRLEDRGSFEPVIALPQELLDGTAARRFFRVDGEPAPEHADRTLRVLELGQADLREPPENRGLFRSLGKPCVLFERRREPGEVALLLQEHGELRLNLARRPVGPRVLAPHGDGRRAIRRARGAKLRGPKGERLRFGRDLRPARAVREKLGEPVLVVGFAVELFQALDRFVVSRRAEEGSPRDDRYFGIVDRPVAELDETLRGCHSARKIGIDSDDELERSGKPLGFRRILVQLHEPFGEDEPHHFLDRLVEELLERRASAPPVIVFRVEPRYLEPEPRAGQRIFHGR